MGQYFLIPLDLSEAEYNADTRTVSQRIIATGWTADGKKHYGADALTKAAPIFEGLNCYDGHQSKDRLSEPRRTTELTGWLTDVHMREDGLYATRHFWDNAAGRQLHDMVAQIKSGQAPPNAFGASINAFGRATKQDGKLMVESIDAAYSVDDVTSPNAGGAFMTESADHSLTAMLLEQLTFQEWFDARPEFVKRIQKEMKTVRQEKAIREAKADADTLTGALLETAHLLEQAQAQITKLTEDLHQSRRALALERITAKLDMPAVWIESLRESLMSAPEDEWTAIIGRERAKATNLPGPKQSDPIAGAGQRIQEQASLPTLGRKEHPAKPRDDEDYDDWYRRTHGG